ncbi:hypothetical protein VP01_696g2 [Puccinia sorghi]|uniref:Uncharacterized protein n=1 Tax=Puccinia sorghi TaxID=27349 RepID=A0A0L6UE35_9BASI|nr:hypothetical protein VP01_696g2 [Puccinia sorghi]
MKSSPSTLTSLKFASPAPPKKQTKTKTLQDSSEIETIKLNEHDSISTQLQPPTPPTHTHTHSCREELGQLKFFLSNTRSSPSILYLLPSASQIGTTGNLLPPSLLPYPLTSSNFSANYITPCITLNCETICRTFRACTQKCAPAVKIIKTEKRFLRWIKNILWRCWKQFNFIFPLKNYLSLQPVLQGRMAWHCKAVCKNANKWPGTARQCVEIKSNGLELKEKPGVGGRCMAIQSNFLELKGIVWQFKVMAGHCREVHGNSDKFPETARKCVKSKSNGMTLCVTFQNTGLELTGRSVWQFKGMAWNWQAVCGNEVHGNLKEWPGTERKWVAIERNGLALQGSV